MPLPLGRLLFFSSVVTSGSCTLIYYLIQKAFSKASYYQLALEQLHSRPEALEALGPPLHIHYLHLTDKYNFVDIADAQNHGTLREVPRGLHPRLPAARVPATHGSVGSGAGFGILLRGSTIVQQGREFKLKIPVSGSKSEGHLYVSSSRDAPFQRWHLQEVFLKLKDGQQIPVFKHSGNSGHEVKEE